MAAVIASLIFYKIEYELLSQHHISFIKYNRYQTHNKFRTNPPDCNSIEKMVGNNSAQMSRAFTGCGGI